MKINITKHEYGILKSALLEEAYYWQKLALKSELNGTSEVVQNIYHRAEEESLKLREKLIYIAENCPFEE